MNLLQIPPPWLFTGLSWNDIEKLPSKQILKDLPYLKDVDLPYHLGRKLTEMVNVMSYRYYCINKF